MSGSVALITGGASGFGAEVARQLVRRGDQVVLVDIDEQGGQAVADELDTIVRQSEDSERVVREMEALLRSDMAAWGPELGPETATRLPEPGAAQQAGPVREKVKRR